MNILQVVKMIFLDKILNRKPKDPTEELKVKSDEELHRLSISAQVQESKSALQQILGVNNTGSGNSTTTNSNSSFSGFKNSSGSTFEKAAELILNAEGGYSNHPKDRGGPTMRGVTWQAFNAHASKLGLAKINYTQTTASKTQVKSYMQAVITKDVALQIYKWGYWDNTNCEKFDNAGYPKTALALFDISINSGPGRINQRLREALGGVGGDLLIAARNSGMSDLELANKVLDAQHRFRQGLSSWSSFGKGWTNRWKKLKEAVKFL